MAHYETMTSDKDKNTTLLLCIFGGALGAHHFYVGNIGKGLLYMFTVGFFIVGWIFDIFKILAGNFKDKTGALITNSKPKNDQTQINTQNINNILFKNEYSFWSLQCGKCIVILEDDRITIKRKGFLAFCRYGLKGEKVVFLRNISGIQLKEAKMTVGYLQLVIIGSQESKGGLGSAIKDENTIVFGGGFNNKELNKNAKKIKNHIEDYLMRINNPSATKTDKYDSLAKIKKLLDDGVLSQEEFEKEKQKIL